MSVYVITSDDPYVRDVIEGHEHLPALTRKNADFMEAVVRLDSTYRRDFDPNCAPDPDFDLEEDYSNSKGRYCGSVAYWFNRMQSHHEEFGECVLGAVISIDSYNKTHLEATLDGRRKMRDIILSCCDDVESLKLLLLKPFAAKDKDHLVSRLTVPLDAVRKGQKRCNLSFASKFCSYAAKFLDLPIEYSKYDGIVSENLPAYVNVYLQMAMGSRFFLCPAESYSSKLETYEKYSDYIGRVIQASGGCVNREEFDHIVWYAFK